MEQVIIISILVAILYLGIKVVSMKYIEKQFKPLRDIVRDTIIVFISSYISTLFYFKMNVNISNFLDVVTDSKTLIPSTTQVFTGEPGF
jgi:hypothetical protein